MATIRCPHCGSPVMVRGNRWECGWCGDSGALKRSDTVSVSLSVSIVYHIDLPETWSNLKAALAALFPDKSAALRPLLSKAFLHAISSGIQHRKTPVEEQKLQELKAFLAQTHDMYMAGSVHEVLRSIAGGALYKRSSPSRSAAHFGKRGYPV